MGSVANAVHREPWNKGKIVGQKVPFKLKPGSVASNRTGWVWSSNAARGIAIRRQFAGWNGRMIEAGRQGEQFMLPVPARRPIHPRRDARSVRVFGIRGE
jgi:hypothetical protein